MSNDIPALGQRPAPPAQDLTLPHTAKPAPEQAPKVAVQSSEKATQVAPHVDPEVRRRELQQAIERLNEQVKKMSFSLNFSFDDASKHIVVKMRDANGEVVRQIPDEAILRLAEQPQNIKGLLQDGKI